MIDEPEEVEHWYRFDDPGFEDKPYLQTYKVLRHTPKGVQLKTVGWTKRNIKFVLDASHKQWACPTIEKAKESYRRRKAKQVEIYEARLNIAIQNLAMASNDEFITSNEWSPFQ